MLVVIIALLTPYFLYFPTLPCQRISLSDDDDDGTQISNFSTANRKKEVCAFESSRDISDNFLPLLKVHIFLDWKDMIRIQIFMRARRKREKSLKNFFCRVEASWKLCNACRMISYLPSIMLMVVNKIEIYQGDER